MTEIKALKARIQRRLQQQQEDVPWYKQLLAMGLFIAFLVMLSMGLDAIEAGEPYAGFLLLGITYFMAFYAGTRASKSLHNGDGGDCD